MKWTERDNATLLAMVAGAERDAGGYLRRHEWTRIATRLGRTVRAVQARFKKLEGAR